MLVLRGALWLLLFAPARLEHYVRWATAKRCGRGQLTSKPTGSCPRGCDRGAPRELETSSAAGCAAHRVLVDATAMLLTGVQVASRGSLRIAAGGRGLMRYKLACEAPFALTLWAPAPGPWCVSRSVPSCGVAWDEVRAPL
jgi:hypothetical protein